MRHLGSHTFWFYLLIFKERLLIKIEYFYWLVVIFCPLRVAANIVA